MEMRTTAADKATATNVIQSNTVVLRKCSVLQLWSLLGSLCTVCPAFTLSASLTRVQREKICMTGFMSPLSVKDWPAFHLIILFSV